MSNPGFAWLEVEPCISCGAIPYESCVTMTGLSPGKPTQPHGERLYIALAKKGNVYGIPIGGYADVVDR